MIQHRQSITRRVSKEMQRSADLQPDQGHPSDGDDNPVKGWLCLVFLVGILMAFVSSCQ